MGQVTFDNHACHLKFTSFFHAATPFCMGRPRPWGGDLGVDDDAATCDHRCMLPPYMRGRGRHDAAICNTTDRNLDDHDHSC